MNIKNRDTKKISPALESPTDFSIPALSICGCGEWTGKQSYDCNKDNARIKSGTCVCVCHKNPAAVSLGRKGGIARAKSLSAKRRKEIATKASHSRIKSPKKPLLTNKEV